MKTSLKSRIPHVSVVLLSHNQKNNTLECLNSFQSVTYENFTIFLVDNGSIDGTYEAVREAFPSVQIFRSKINLGCAGGRNHCAQKAIEQYSTGYLLILDNDIVVEPDFIDHLVETADENQNSGIVTSKILNFNNRDVIDTIGNGVNLYTGKVTKVGSGEKDRGQYDSLFHLEAANGCCQLIAAELWKELAGFDEAFSPYGYEDTDLSLRVRKLNKKILLAHKAKIYHKGTQTLGGGKYISAYTSVKGKNMRLFLFKHAKLHHRIGFLFAAPLLAVGSIQRAIRAGDLRAAFRMFFSFFCASHKEINPRTDPAENQDGFLLPK